MKNDVLKWVAAQELDPGSKQLLMAIAICDDDDNPPVISMEWLEALSEICRVDVRLVLQGITRLHQDALLETDAGFHLRVLMPQ